MPERARSSSRRAVEVDDPKEIEEELGKAVNQNDDLRDALDEARSAILLQDETIKALTDDRYALGTILSFQKSRLREPRENELQPGSIVRLKKGDGAYGKVAEVRPDGRYRVVFFEGQDENEGLFYGNSSEEPDEESQLLLWRPSVARVAYEAKVLEIPVLPGVEYTAGQTVRIQMDNLQICSPATEELIGEVVRVVRRFDNRTCEVASNGSNIAVRTGPFENDILEEGDQVVLDRSGQVILRKVGKSGNEYLFTQQTGVDWDSIGGLEEAKDALREAFELPFAHKDSYKWLKMEPPKGILLFGPPGCGKTLLGKAVATALSRIYTGKTETSGFFYIRGPEVLQRYVGESEAKIREIFLNAKKFKEKNGFPAVIFIDEAEGLLRVRGSGISSDVEITIVDTFLTMMDGLEESGAIVMLTSNRPDMIDPTVLRPGRIDRKILITRPGVRNAEDIFAIHLKGIPLSGDIYSHSAAGARAIFNPELVLYEITGKRSGKTSYFRLADLVSGAMIEEVCNRGKLNAFKRCVASGKLSPVTEDDLRNAVEEIYQESAQLKDDEALRDFIADFGEELSIKKITFTR